MTLNEIKAAESSYWQKLMRAGGYYAGAIDGRIGPKSQAAEQRWLADAAAAKEEIGTFDDRSEKNIETLIPSTQRLARIWLREAKAACETLGVEVRIICGTRTYGEQHKLFNQRPRVTKADAGHSWHNFGLAWDFGVFQGKSYLGNSKHYATFGNIARTISLLTWGGDWTSFKDEPHIQHQKFGSTAEARKNFER